MAIRKVCGIETEYGIVLRGAAESNPIMASSLLINAYVNQLQRKVGWDFEDESPGRDARGFARFDKAGERILARSMVAAGNVLPPEQSIVVYKNNSDRKGNSYGTH